MKTSSQKEMQYLFEQDSNGAFKRLIIPAEFVATILSPDKTDAMDLREKKNQDLTTNEVIVLKKYAYELANNIEKKELSKMNNENVIQEIDKKNEIFIRDLMNKNCFMIDWHEGAVIPKTHPRFYDGRIEVSIRKSFNNSYGNISFGKDEYQVSDEVVDKLYNYVETNIDRLIKISLNQNTEMYEGVSDNVFIKFKSIYVSLSGLNTTSEEEKNTIKNIKNDLKNIILNSSALKEDNGINNETLELVIKETAGSEDIDKSNLLIKLTKKIIDLPTNNEITIAQLMMLKNEEVAMIDPLTQGEIFNLLMKVCEKLNIKIEINHDEFGGLGYHYKFKKINSTNNDNIINELVDAIDKLPKGTEIALSSIMGDKFKNYSTNELFEINKKVLSACKERGIILNYDKYKDQAVGLPFNIPFIKE